MDRSLRRLEADMMVIDAENMFLVSGLGEIIEPDDDMIALGSGGFLCFGRGARHVQVYGTFRQGNRGSIPANRFRDLCLYQLKYFHRRVED